MRVYKHTQKFGLFLNTLTIQYDLSIFQEIPLYFDQIQYFNLVAIQKAHHLGKGTVRLTEKVTKSDIVGRGCGQKQRCHSLTFTLTFLCVSKFCLFCISRGSDNITMSRNKNTPKRIVTSRVAIWLIQRIIFNLFAKITC